MAKGCLGVLNLSFYLLRKGLDPPSPWVEHLPMGGCNFISHAVALNGPLTDDIFLQEGWFVEKLKNTALPGF